MTCRHLRQRATCALRLPCADPDCPEGYVGPAMLLLYERRQEGEAWALHPIMPSEITPTTEPVHHEVFTRYCITNDTPWGQQKTWLWKPVPSLGIESTAHDTHH